MIDNLDIKNEMACFDHKDRGFYDRLSAEEQKRFSPFLMIRWGATVEGNADFQAYYLMSCNEKLNRNFFDISSSRHKKLLWLLATTVSPGMGRQRHPWLAAKKRDTTNNKSEKFLRVLYPDRRDDEIALMSQLNTKADLRELARAQGWTEKQIKEYL